MDLTETFFKTDERVLYSLRKLYHQHGYLQYKLRKFESYDLYMQNKNFLPSKHILTFHDMNGSLMALKPDVTLSIVKNTKNNDITNKVYYTEHVYRVPRDAEEFHEILQTGLECIGNVGLMEIAEVIMLAVKSLETITDDYVLNLSHIGIISGILLQASLDEELQKSILKAIAARNVHELTNTCTKANVPKETLTLLQSLIKIYGPLEKAISCAGNLNLPPESKKSLEELKELQFILSAFGVTKKINLDFSIVNDMDYYNGLFFRGYVSGLSDGILAGGQYDNLMSKMGKDAAAIGFAVYLDQLERYNETKNRFDIDTLIIYDKNSDLKTVAKIVSKLTDEDKSVRILNCNTDTISYRTKIQVIGEEVVTIENND